MKQTLIITCLLLMTLANAGSAEPLTPQDEQLLLAIREVQTQQAAIAENQAKIEEKLTTLAETVRIARIYSSRSGN